MKLKSFFLPNIADLYIILWFFYMHQGTFPSIRGSFFQVLLAVLLLLSAYYAVMVVTKFKNPPYFKGLGWFFVFITFYGVLQLVSNESIVLKENGFSVQRFEYLKMLLISLLPIYAFYYYSKRGYITEGRLTFYSIVFVLLAIYSFFGNQSQILAERRSAEAFEITNNVGYVFVSIIPLLALVKRNTLKYILLFVCVAFALLSVKRGAIVTGLLIMVIFLYSTLKYSEKRKFLTWVFVIAIGVGVYYFTNKLFQTNTYFQLRVEGTMAGDESTRDIIYRDLWNHFLHQSSTLNMLFGNGAFATTRFTINYAHNDWLEILIDNGLLGIVMYFIYWVLFYKTWRIARKQNNAEIALAILLVMTFSFIKTFFSMSFNVMELNANLALGYSMSKVASAT